MSWSKKMTIARIDVALVNLPMIHSFTTSFGTIKDKQTVLVKMTTTDGVVGWGEGAALPFPDYKPDTTATTFLALEKYLAPRVVGKTINHPSEIVNLYANVKGHNFAKTALETAGWMAFSLTTKTALTKLLGGTKKQIGVGESIGIKPSIEETLEEVGLRLSEGFQRIKVKIQPGWDLKIIKSIRNKFADIDLMVDGNSAYTLEDTKTLKSLDQFKLTMIEQPLADDDLIDHATLQKQLNTPICLDESILSADDARKAIQVKACKIINIKPGRVGGLTESKKIHDLCKKNKVGVWCGGMLETGIGRAFNIALSSLANFTYPADMSPSHFYYQEDLVNPTFQVNQKGYIKVPQSPGMGYSVDNKRIKKYTQKMSTVK
jgi:O-succinylbenzoate synthase